MISEIFATLFSLVVVQPFNDEMKQRLTAAGASPEALTRLAECARVAPGLLAERASSEPGWTMGTAIKVWFGALPAGAVLGELTPQCANISAPARPDRKA